MGSDGRSAAAGPRSSRPRLRTDRAADLRNEPHRADVPLPRSPLATVGRLCRGLAAGQKTKFLPGILPVDVHFAIGYTEPGRHRSGFLVGPVPSVR